MSLLEQSADALWNPWLPGLFLFTGLFFSLRTGFFQLFSFRIWWNATAGRLLRGRRDRTGRGITQLQALSTALAATIGTGSVAGVATAIFCGGPGAVFWMWVSALLGMMTGCAEKTLAVKYRVSVPGGGWQGGPMYYMANGLGLRPLAALFCLCCIGETLAGGGLIQSNSIAAALHAAFGVNRPGVGLCVAAAAGAVILGGIGRIGRVSERLVPCMAALFLAGGLAVLLCHIRALPGALACIVTDALSPRAAAGGYGAAAALRYGVARGVFTNEAGMGTSAMAHAAADTPSPAAQGMWGIFEVFTATLVVCSVTALVILTSGVYDPAAALAAIEGGRVTDDMLGAPLSAAAFSTVLGRAGSGFVAVCLLLFAFTSLLGACYYGEQCVSWLTGSRRLVPVYRGVFLAAVAAGSVGDVSRLWLLVDLTGALMALPNLIALLLLSREAVELIRGYTAAPPVG